MEKKQSCFIWPVVSIICALIIASGIYFGLRDSQPQLTNQDYLEKSPSNYAASEEIVPTASNNNTLTVYVTRTGECYHRGTCRYLSKSKIPMNLSQAKKRYRACSKCRPSE